MQKVRRHPPPSEEGSGPDCLWASGFRVCFTALVALLFTFPSRYWFAIGRQGVLRLGGWSPHVRTGFHVSRPTRGHTGFLPVRGCHPLWPDFPDGSGSYLAATGLVRVRSPLLAESRLMSFPPGTEMFQFPGFAPARYGFTGGYPLAGVGCPIRRSPDRSPLAAPRGLSQRATSFVASWRQGIHQMPFLSLDPAQRQPRPEGRRRPRGGPSDNTRALDARAQDHKH